MSKGLIFYWIIKCVFLQFSIPLIFKSKYRCWAPAWITSQCANLHSAAFLLTIAALNDLFRSQSWINSLVRVLKRRGNANKRDWSLATCFYESLGKNWLCDVPRWGQLYSHSIRNQRENLCYGMRENEIVETSLKNIIFFSEVLNIHLNEVYFIKNRNLFVKTNTVGNLIHWTNVFICLKCMVEWKKSA